MKSIFKFSSLMMILALVVFVSCKEDDPTPAGDPIASFAIDPDATNESYLTVSFLDGSTNATSWEWNFGDPNSGDMNTSVEQDPMHTFSADGTYTVTLVVKNADGKASEAASLSVDISDPDIFLKAVAGDESKTWKLFREGTSLQWGSAPETNNIWVGLTNDGSRPCLYTQTFTFNRDMQFIFDDNNVFWGEYTPWLGTAVHETCFVPDDTNMKAADGTDLSAWRSGTHAFSVEAATENSGVVTLDGTGAWMGFTNVAGGDVYLASPADATKRELNITITEGEGYELMTIIYTNSADVWTCKYVHYTTGTEPALKTAPDACVALDVFSPSIISHSFASNDAAEWNNLQPFAESASTLAVGVDDPDPAGTGKVGKITRVAGVQYQEMQFKIEPFKSVNWENITTLSLEVYIPSSNVFTGTLTDDVNIGLGATKCQPPNWYETQIQYEAKVTDRDKWVTLTYDIVADMDTNNSGVASPKATNIMDMIYIAVGGGNHFDGGDFYVRNLKFE